MALLSTHKLDVTIANKCVCKELDWDIEAGECWGILGSNGVGKTTLLYTMAGLRTPQGGEIRLNNQLIQSLSRRNIARQLGMVFQDSADAFPATVLETAVAGRHPYLGPLQWEGTQDFDIAREALRIMELQQMESRLVNTLSGGERRRLSIATLLSQDPSLSLLDEPVNHLDLHHQIRTLSLFRERTLGQQKAVLITMHDINLSMRFCTHVLMLFGNGEVLYGKTAQVMHKESLERLYNHPLQYISTENGGLFLPL